MSAIQTKFGGSNPISLSEYYKGGSNVPSTGLTEPYTIPTSGQISIGDFRGADLIQISATQGTTTYFSEISESDSIDLDFDVRTVFYVSHSASNVTLTLDGEFTNNSGTSGVSFTANTTNSGNTVTAWTITSSTSSISQFKLVAGTSTTNANSTSGNGQTTIGTTGVPSGSYNAPADNTYYNVGSPNSNPYAAYLESSASVFLSESGGGTADADWELPLTLYIKDTSGSETTYAFTMRARSNVAIP